MPEQNEQAPDSPTAIAMATGMGVPGIDLTDVRGTLEEALVFPPTRATARADAAESLEVVPGQSGAEGLAELPHSGAGDPWDGP
ncbi:MAG TPA: hypothetical protein VK464_09085 [Symbiobacteriaceae bacterium]|nr:hypothetical protein [Symbiobacteriaceae bacterium]